MSKKIIKLTEEKFKRILAPIFENEFGNLNIESNPEINVVFVGRDEIRKMGDMLWDMLTSSYASIGGLKTYRNKEHFLKMAKYAKIAYLGENVVACAIYRNMENSYKMVAIGCNQEDDGKEGIQAIIRDDISQADFHFWAETSGAIEHYFKKYNGYPMPNIIVPKILNVDEESIRLSTNDAAHYERVIGGEWYRKLIFGIKSKEMYDEAVRAVEDYSKFMKEVNNINEANTNGLRFTLHQATYIIENILRAHEEDDFNELIPSWNKALHDALETLLVSERTQMVEDYIEYCEYLLSVMVPLELHELKL